MFSAHRMVLVGLLAFASLQHSVAQISASHPFRLMAPLNGSINRNVGYVDFDGDGLLDSFAGYFGGLAIAYGLPGGGLGPYQVLLTGAANRSYNTSGVFDADLDGILDLGVSEFGGPTTPLWLYFGDGARGVRSPISLPLQPGPPTPSGNTMIPLHVPGQTRPVLIVLNRHMPPLSAFQNTLSAITYNPTSGSWESSPIGLVSAAPYWGLDLMALPSGDFNGDGFTDWIFAVRSLFGTLPNNGSTAVTHLGVIRGLSQAPWFDLNMHFFPLRRPAEFSYVLRLDDINQDGCSDIALWGLEDRFAYDWSILSWLGDRQTVLRDQSVYTSINRMGPNGMFWSPMRSMQTNGWGLTDFEDYDQDGVRDLVYRSEVSVPSALPGTYTLVGRMIDFHRGKRDGTFSPAMRLSDPSMNVLDVARYDVDGDGDLDIVDFVRVPGQPYVSINDSIMGVGLPAANGQTPRIGRGVAFLGNREFFIDIEGAPPSAAVVLAVATRPAAVPGAIGIDLSSLLWPPGAFGPALTTLQGHARLKLPIPNDPALAGLGLFFQWAVASPTPTGYALTPTAKIVLWP